MVKLTGGIMAESAPKTQSLSEAMQEIVAAKRFPPEQIQAVVERYQAGQLELDAEDLANALHVPQLLVALNDAGLSLDEMDRLVAEGGLREMTSFSALVVWNSSYAGRFAGNAQDYAAEISRDEANLKTLSAIYTREGRTITEDEFINGVSNLDPYLEEPYLVFGQHDINYSAGLAQRMKNATIAAPDFDVTRALIDQSVFARRDNHEGDLSVVDLPGKFNNALNTFPDYSRYEPQSSFDYTVQPGDHLLAVAARLQPVIGAEKPDEAGRKIALLNGSADVESFSRALQPGQILKIPVDPAYEVVQHNVEKGESLNSLTAQYNMASKGPTVASLVATFNNLQNQDLIQPGQVLNIPIRSDGADLSPVEAPPDADNKATTLYVTESYDQHHFDTYGTAVQYAASAFPAYQDSGLSIKPLNPRNNDDMSITVDQLVRKGGPTDTIFSLSLSNKPNFSMITPQAAQLDQEAIEYYRHHAPNVLVSAGNNFQASDEQYSVMSQIGSRNAFIVGATHKDDRGESYVAPYSSPGADFTSTPLIPIDGKKVFGTSFSAPSLATSAAQFNSWYGNRLSFEEIMYAGMLSTRIDIADCTTVQQPECSVPELKTGVFVTNGAGLPHHARAGAGEIDLNRWKDNLDRLATLKQDQNLTNKPVEFQLTAHDLVNARTPSEQNNYVYEYDVQIPADMMMGKIVVEAGPLTRVQIESPSGYETYLGASVRAGTHTSTSAFAFEEYKAGNTMRITTDHPLGQDFRITLQGQEPGSALGALRDALQEEGQMPTPHSTYENGVEANRNYVQSQFGQPMPEEQPAAQEMQRAEILKIIKPALNH